MLLRGNVVKTISAAAFIFVLSVCGHASENTIQSGEEESFWKAVKKKSRFFTFSELMGPAFKANPASIPTNKGQQLDPINLYTTTQLDFEIAPKTRILWYQRIPYYISHNTLNEVNNVEFFDPRFAYRKLDFIDYPGAKSTADFYFQPGSSHISADIGRLADIGFAINMKAPFAKTNWQVGWLSDFRLSFFKANGVSDGHVVSGYLSPWAGYYITPRLQTQHWLVVPYLHNRNEPLNTWGWGYPGAPFVQNGLGYSVSPRVWVALLLNNYVNIAPKLENTWMSFWLSTSLL
ncbi:MAG: hypothetical protein AB7F43_13795 [Bacteriovoracia bacterium]